MSINRSTKTCVACEVELRVKQNGVALVELTTTGADAIHEADLWHCPVCGYEVIAGVGEQPTYAHWDGNVIDEVKRRESCGQRVVRCWLNEREKQAFLDNATAEQVQC